MAKGRFVLVVDDDAPSAKLMNRLLDAGGYACRTTSSGEEALEVLWANPGAVGLVLLDLAMPIMSGFDVCRTIRSDPELAHIPVVAITANVDSEYLREAQEAGFNTLLTKPFTRGELETVLAEHFASE